MTCIAVRCPCCDSDQLGQGGTTRRGTQRDLCHTTACPPQRFRREDSAQGRVPAIQQQRMALSLNTRGVRDTARVLRIRTDIVLRFAHLHRYGKYALNVEAARIQVG